MHKLRTVRSTTGMELPTASMLWLPQHLKVLEICSPATNVQLNIVLHSVFYRNAQATYIIKETIHDYNNTVSLDILYQSLFLPVSLGHVITSSSEWFLHNELVSSILSLAVEHRSARKCCFRPAQRRMKDDSRVWYAQYPPVTLNTQLQQSTRRLKLGVSSGGIISRLKCKN